MQDLKKLAKPLFTNNTINYHRAERREVNLFVNSQDTIQNNTRGALSREHAYATIAFLQQLHHYFGTHQICSPSYKAYTLFINKKSLF